VLYGFQYGYPVLCGLTPVVVLRSFGDRVEVFAVSVPLSPSLGLIQPWSGIKLVIRCSSATYLVTAVLQQVILLVLLPPYYITLFIDLLP
jgi:hypothetical protein